MFIAISLYYECFNWHKLYFVKYKSNEIEIMLHVFCIKRASENLSR